VRTSETLGENFMYASIKADDGAILRLAYSYPGFLKSAVSQFPAIAAAMGAALILALVLAGRFSADIANPLKKVADALSTHDFASLERYKSSYYEIDKTIQSIWRLLDEAAAANQKLVSEREKVQYILSGMAEGFIMLDSDKKILLCNESAKKFLGAGANADNILTRVWDDRIAGAIDDALTAGKSSSVQWSPRGGLFLRVSVSPLQPGESRNTKGGATVILANITRERRFEKQKQDFFSNASHELKTPITSILGFAEMLDKNVITKEDEKRNVMIRIEKEARRMSELIDDILMISNLESKTEPADRSIFDFETVVRESVDSILPVKDGEWIDISLDLESAPVLANRRQLRELCSNLVDNAVKYNKIGGAVSVSLRKAENRAILVVSDTGVGIAPKYHARVFERFFRVNADKDKKVGGTGLGLSIVKHIVNLYGGKISLKSKEGEGTSIEIILDILSNV
jgi:two-component system phosphate regulon sensor histidine kinase PhoR